MNNPFKEACDFIQLNVRHVYGWNYFELQKDHRWPHYLRENKYGLLWDKDSYFKDRTSFVGLKK